MRRFRDLLLAGAVSLLGAACGNPRSLSIQIVTPQVADLDPTLDDRLEKLSLVDENTGLVLAEQPFASGQTSVTLPRLPLGFKGDLRLNLLDGSGRLLGLGRTPDASFTAPSGTVVGGAQLRFYVRKPLAYVGGPKGTTVVDTTRSAQLDYSTTPPPFLPPGRVTAVAALRDGRSVLVGTEGAAELDAIDTSTNTVAKLLDLSSPLRRIIPDPTERVALLIQDAGMTFYPLPQSRERAAEILPLTNPADTTAAFSRDGATLFLITDLHHGDCGPQSQMQRRSSLGLEISTTLPLPASVADVGIHPRTGNPLVASPCTGEVLEIDPDTGDKIGAVIDGLPLVSTLSVVGETVVAMASNSGAQGLQLHAKVATPAGTMQEIKVVWPRATLELLAYRKDQTTVTINIAPVVADLRAVAVTPGLDRAVALARLEYEDTSSICNGLHVVRAGFLVVNLSPGAPGGVWVTTSNEVTKAAGCVQPPTPGFELTTATLLFGGD